MLSHYLRLLQSLQDFEVRYVMVGVDGFNQWVPDGQSGLETQDMDLAFMSTRANTRALLDAIEAAKDPQTGERFVVLASDGARVKKIATSSSSARRQNAKWLAENLWSLVVEMPNSGYQAEFIRSVKGFTFEELEEDAILFDRKVVPMRVAQLGKILESKKLCNRPKDQAFFKKYRNLIDGALDAARARATGLVPDQTPRKKGIGH